MTPNSFAIKRKTIRWLLVGLIISTVSAVALAVFYRGTEGREANEIAAEFDEAASADHSSQPHQTPSSALTAGDPARGCDEDDSNVLIGGDQAGQYKDLALAHYTTIDATSATWIGVSDYPIRISGGERVCWHGGDIRGAYPDTDSWDRMHDTAAFTVTLPGFVGVGIRVHNYGDAINIVDDAENFTVRELHLTYIRDDCIENDRLHSGVVEDSLLDGCYTAFSARPNPNDSKSDGTADVWIIRRSLIRLQPMPTVYKGDAPGHGMFFKWDKNGRGPMLELHDNIFRVDQLPNAGDLGVPEGYLASCSNNVVVWLGEGEFPDSLPDCFTITTEKAVWDEAVAAWKATFKRYD